MNEHIKVPYNPSNEKRFEISKDEYSRERLQSIKSFYENIHSKFNISMGLVLFGSLAKGKELTDTTKDEADVDFTLYIDIDEYREKYIENLRNNKDFLNFEIRRLNGICQNFIERKLLIEVDQKIRESIDLNQKEIEFVQEKLKIYSPDQFIFFLAVWHGYVDIYDTTSNQQDFSFRGKRQYPIERLKHLLQITDVQALPIQISGESSIQSQVEIVKHLNEDFDQDTAKKEYILNQERCGVARMFGLDIGGGMKRYRQAFIHELFLLPQEERTKLWDIVNDSVRIWERGNAIPGGMEKQFPKTPDEAALYFGVQTSS